MRTSPFDPEPIEVITVNGIPSRIIFRKKMQSVKEVSNLWRIDDLWWQKPVRRLYYVLELERGAKVTVFHDLVGRAWYRQSWTA
jgi:hypothetical protein